MPSSTAASSSRWERAPSNPLRSEVPQSEVARLLGYPAGWPLEGEVRELADWARGWCRAHAHTTVAHRFLEIGRLGESEVEWSGGVFRSAVLAERLRAGGAHAFVAVALSTGSELEREVERLTQGGKVVEATFLDRFGAALVEWMVHQAEHDLHEERAEEGERLLAPLSPGHEDWVLTDQPSLFGVFEGACGDLELLDSGMLRPRNALLTVFGVTRSAAPEDRKPSRCSRCTWSPCAFRRP